MVPELWSETGRIFCHFGPFFAFLPNEQSAKSKLKKKNEKRPRDFLAYTSVP